MDNIFLFTIELPFDDSGNIVWEKEKEKKRETSLNRFNICNWWIIFFRSFYRWHFVEIHRTFFADLNESVFDTAYINSLPFMVFTSDKVVPDHYNKFYSDVSINCFWIRPHHFFFSRPNIIDKTLDSNWIRFILIGKIGSFYSFNQENDTLVYHERFPSLILKRKKK